MVLKVVKADGSALANEDEQKVAPAPLVGQCIFDIAEVYLIYQLVSHASGAYPFRCFLEDALSYDRDRSEGMLSVSGFYPDRNGYHLKFDHSFGELVRGLGLKQEMIKLSEPMVFIQRLHADLFNSERALLPEMNVRVRLIRNRPGFGLVTPTESKDKYKLVLDKASLCFKTLTPSDRIMLGHARLLASGEHVIYPIKRVQTKTIMLASGAKSFNLDNVIMNRLPYKIIVGMVKASAFNGDMDKTPFYFEPFGLSRFAAFVSGRSVMPRPLQPNFKKDVFKTAADSYFSVFQATQQEWSPRAGFSYDLKEYLMGYTLFGFDLSINGSGCGNTVNVHKSGNLRFELEFAESLAEPVTMIIYGEYGANIEINRAKEVLVDYTP